MRYVIAVVVSMLLSSPVLASHCPSLVKKIDDQLATVDLDSETRERIETLRDKGLALHKQGKHGNSVEVLDQALDELKAAEQ
ncbi:MAG: hypothetical protein CL581_12695 [Alteromonadaceae bacterium]|mgnify:CR=1 FL=1|uniref:hypothetical protein n=1 Tax=Marinobacter sp. V034 TaxID=3459610 RepID=UPI000C4968C4|nr:hypothetical protein [Alteromonadaceae bacterium]MBH86190.1 hypothetical protein [Alteromonadaceae bacterium]|tara:strand:- start:400 stop:645 length:246 start_codon:yes stop_codon:yes gene_type:complete